MPPSSRHGRLPTFGKPIATVFWLVVVGVVAVTLLADQRLAIQLAVAGALSASLMIWSVYDTALREARSDHGHEHTLHARTVGAAAEKSRTQERTITSLQNRVDQLERDLVEANAVRVTTDSTDLWSDLSEAPTIVDMANRRHARPVSIVKKRAETG